MQLRWCAHVSDLGVGQVSKGRYSLLTRLECSERRNTRRGGGEGRMLTRVSCYLHEMRRNLLVELLLLYHAVWKGRRVWVSTIWRKVAVGLHTLSLFPSC